MSEFTIEWSLKLKAEPGSDIASTPAGGEGGISQRVVCKNDAVDTREWGAEDTAGRFYLTLCRDLGIKPEAVLHIPVKMLDDPTNG